MVGRSGRQLSPCVDFSRLVLPGRIELPTSALPRMRSTTELRQHGRGSGRIGVDGGVVKERRAGLAQAMADPTQSDARAARLAAALRANLAKRKARERGEKAVDKPPED